VLNFQDEDLIPFTLNGGVVVPLIQMTGEDLPDTEVRVGDESYTYERSYNVKGYSAVMPRRVRELMSEGKKPLVIERPTRYYLYVST